MKLSIIVPIYNVEPYLSKCIESLLQQDISQHEYEIILVNDGSPDNSKKIIIEYLNQYSNIVFVDQLNQGVSVARNNGIDIAKGDYILFIDPDDYIHVNALKLPLDYAIKNNLDILYLKQTSITLDGKVLSEYDFSKYENQVIQSTDFFRITRDILKIGDGSVAILIKRSNLNHENLRFPKDVSFLEDSFFLGKLHLIVKNCGFHFDDFYYRTIREGSVMQSTIPISQKAIDGFFIGIRDYRIFCDALKTNNFHIKNTIIAIRRIINVTSVIRPSARSNRKIIIICAPCTH
jgi:glycosyltransferase involved in cell wall biosynthesis